ncbi:MAG: hypothetical protein L0Z62_23645 [Gemmataceae bacterium]|nr:hypothetical protein [Gemmataceae bacterium]
MAIEASCSCGKRFKAHDKYAGKRVLCPACKQPLQIPDLEILDVDLEPLEEEEDSAAYGVGEADSSVLPSSSGGLYAGGELSCFRLGSGKVIHILAVSANGAVGLAAIDRTVYVLNIRQGRKYFRLEGHKAPLEGLAVSRDGALAASGDPTGAMVLWDLATRKPRWSLRGHLAQLRDIAFAPNGAHVLSCGDDQFARLWEVASGREVWRVKDPEPLMRCAFTPHGAQVVVGTEGGSVLVWDLRQGGEAQRLKGPPAPIEALGVNHDGGRILAAAFPKGAQWVAWDRGSKGDPNRYGKTVKGHHKDRRPIAFCADGTRFLAAGDSVAVPNPGSDKPCWATPVMICSVETGEAMRTYEGHRTEVSQGSRPTLGSALGTLAGAALSLGLSDGQDLFVAGGVPGSGYTITALAVSADNSRGLTGAPDGQVQVWGLA